VIVAAASRDRDFAGVLRQFAGVAAALGADHVPREAAALAERLSEGRFFVACVGQFKRGKSTLLNALVGDPVLPTGVVPVTTVVTVLRYGPRRAARVRAVGEEWREIEPSELAAYVSEEGNPGNEKQVDAVEVFVPSGLLVSGMCLVDTPGIGSVYVGNTQVTRDFVPHVDAALIVIGADPPISGEELALAEEVADHTEHLIVVLNKADRLSDAERAEARRFAEQVLGTRLRRPVGPVFELSATERLAGRATRDWTRLEGELAALAQRSGRQLLRDAAERGVARLADRLLRVIEEHRDALVRPLDESERRVGALRRAVAEAERALADLGPLFAAEHARLAQALDAERRVFLAHATSAVTRALAGVSASSSEGSRRLLRQRAMDRARAAARDLVEAWLREVEPRGEDLYRRATRRFIELANGFVASLRASGELGALPAELAPERGFRARRRFYFADLLVVAAADPIRWLAMRLAPRRAALAAARRDAREYLERLLETNSARVANDLIDRVAESRHRLESEIASLLTEIATSAEHALAQARDRQRAGADAVRTELAWLDALHQSVEALRTAPRPHLGE
jgi:GTP-binding protein EngB required for normal cell division